MRAIKDTNTLPLPSTAISGAGAGKKSAPDAGLSAAIRHALGSDREAPHLPERSMKTGQEIARLAKADKPSVRMIAPQKGHVGPRSGHK